MDISLPDQSGLELCKEVKAAYPSVFILGLSTFNEYSFVQKMMVADWIWPPCKTALEWDGVISVTG